MSEPTDEQLKAYSEKLPEVYRETLSCFVEQNEYGYFLQRRAGAMLTLETLDERLQKRFTHYRDGDTEEALTRLRHKRFVETFVEPIFHYKPTQLGERLITAITGKAAIPEEVPELPDPVWA